MNIPTTALQITVTGKETVELQSTPLPPLGRGMILIKTTRSMISTGTETICLGRRFAAGTHWDEWVKYPFATGYSHVGVVAAVGEGVTRYKVGDRLGTTSPHAQFVILSEDSELYPIPAGISDRDAAWTVISTIAQIGVRGAKHEIGQDVAIVGLGPIGQLVLQFVRQTGPRRIIAIDPLAPRLKWARSHGATHLLEMTAAKAMDAVRDINGGRLCDVVYDVTGNPTAFVEAQQLIRRRGTLALVGDTGYPGDQRLSPSVIRNSIQIVASHGSCWPSIESDFAHWTRPNMARLFFDYLKDGRMRVDDLISDEVSPRDCAAIYKKVLHERAGTMGCQFDWTKIG